MVFLINLLDAFHPDSLRVKARKPYLAYSFQYFSKSIMIIISFFESYQRSYRVLNKSYAVCHKGGIKGDTKGCQTLPKSRKWHIQTILRWKNITVFVEKYSKKDH